MKRILWSAGLLLALAWTALAWAASSALQWLLSLTGSAQAPGLAQSVADWTAPGWLLAWTDVSEADIQTAKEFAQWSLDLLQAPPPAFDAVLPWALPVLWLTWALGLAGLALSLALLAWAVRRLRRPARDGAHRLWGWAKGRAPLRSAVPPVSHPQ